MTPREWAEKVLREADTMHGPDRFDIERAIEAAIAEARAMSTDIIALTNERDHLKECWLQSCQHVAEACAILGCDQNTEAPDSWALRDWATRVRRERDTFEEMAKRTYEDRIAGEKALREEIHSRPTAWAYQQACAALEKHRQRADDAEERSEKLEMALRSVAEGPHETVRHCPVCIAQAALAAPASDSSEPCFCRNGLGCKRHGRRPSDSLDTHNGENK